MNNVLLLDKPTFDLKGFRNLLRDGSGLDLSTGDNDPRATLNKLFKSDRSRHLWFTFAIVISDPLVEQLAHLFGVSSVHEFANYNSLSVVVVSANLETIVGLSKLKNADLKSTIDTIVSHVSQCGFSGAF